MTPRFRHIIARTLRSALLLCAALLTHGCASDEPRAATPLPGEMPEGTTLRTGFSLTVGDTSGSKTYSRAPGYLGDGYDTGEGYENYIDIDGENFRFYFFDERNRLVAPISIEAVLPTGQTETSKTYYVSGETNADIRGMRLKVVALANWPEYPDEDALKPGTTTIDDLRGIQYAYSPQAMLPSRENPIPLFGVGRLLTLSFDDLNHAEIGRLHLLRAYAKVEVLKQEGAAIDIESASIVRYNTRGLCAPAGVNNEADYVHGSYDEDYVNTPSVPASAETDGEVPMAKTASGSFIAYVPEYRNIVAADGSRPRPQAERAVIMVRFKGVTGDRDMVEFKFYSGDNAGKHFDLLRNYWYRFALRKNLTPMVQVVPYNEVPLKPDFGLIVGPNYVPVLDDDGKVLYWYDTDTGKYYGPDKTTEVTDPYITTDPDTGWSLVRDDNDRFFCYYVPMDDDFFAIDKKTQILNPFQNVDADTGWNKIIDFSSEKLYYYYDRKNSRWYTPDRVQLPEGEQPVFPGTNLISH